MATAGLIILFLLAGFCLMVIGGAITIDRVKKGLYPGLGPTPNTVEKLAAVLDTMPRPQQLHVLLAILGTTTPEEGEQMEQALEAQIRPNISWPAVSPANLRDAAQAAGGLHLPPQARFRRLLRRNIDLG